MGHRHKTKLPATPRWAGVVSQLREYNATAGQAEKVVAETLRNVQTRFLASANDDGIISSFEFLSRLGVAAGNDKLRQFLSDYRLGGSETLSPVALSSALFKYVQGFPLTEAGTLARDAAADAICSYYQAHSSQLGFFGDQNLVTWKGIGSPAGFCELSRHFFSSFLYRYVAFFVDRSASPSIKSLELRDKFSGRVSEYLTGISTTSFQVAGEMQAYAAGWFATYAKERNPDSGEIRKFLTVALGKLRDDLRREAFNG